MSELPNGARYNIRPANQEDQHLIYDNWLSGYRLSAFAKEISHEVYYTEHKRLVAQLYRGILCAVDPDEPWHVFGWMCGQELSGIPVLHYCYTKKPFRGLGLQHALAASFGVFGSPVWSYTHKTIPGAVIGSRWKGIYSPYLLWRLNESGLHNPKEGANDATAS